MFTVTVGLDGSGKSSTRRPLGRLYSVMPSTVAPLTARGRGRAAVAARICAQLRLVMAPVLAAGREAAGAGAAWAIASAVADTRRSRLAAANRSRDIGHLSKDGTAAPAPGRRTGTGCSMEDVRRAAERQSGPAANSGAGPAIGEPAAGHRRGGEEADQQAPDLEFPLVGGVGSIGLEIGTEPLQSIRPGRGAV